MILAIALGGAFGTVARYLVSVWMKGANDVLPLATLLINVAGSFLIGLFARALAGPASSHVLRSALTIGFCGGFTTFSTFSAELVALYEQGRMARAAAYVAVSVTLGVLATFAGLGLGDRLSSARL